MMKVVILAGGLGTRISEESHLRPKPMIEIPGEADAMPVEKVYCEWKTPLADAPLISSGALRAPPVAA